MADNIVTSVCTCSPLSPLEDPIPPYQHQVLNQRSVSNLVFVSLSPLCFPLLHRALYHTRLSFICPVIVGVFTCRAGSPVERRFFCFACRRCSPTACRWVRPGSRFRGLFTLLDLTYGTILLDMIEWTLRTLYTNTNA